MLSKIKTLLLNNRNTRQTVAKNVFWLTVGQIGSRFFRAFIIIYAARVLGVAEYGIFSYALGLVGVFSIFADFGINDIFTREAAKKPEEEKYYFATVFWIKIILLVLSAVLLLFFAPRFSKIGGVEALLPFAALLIFFNDITKFTVSFFRAKEKMEFEALITTVTNIAITVLGFLILYFTSTAKTLAIAYVLSAATGTLIGIIVLRKMFVGVFTYFKKELVIPLMQAALPLAFAGVVATFMLQIDILMLGALTTAETIGLYSAGQKIVQLLYTLPAILATAFFPSMSKLVGEKDKLKSRLMMERGLVATTLLALPLAIGGIILGKNIIGLLYGNAYLSGALPFQILILTILPVFPSYMLSNYILAYNAQKKLVIYASLGVLINLIMNFLLIPPYGALGAAIATFITHIIYNGAIWFLAKKINNFQVIIHLKKIILAGIVMGISTLTLLTLGINVILNIAISALIYLFTLYLLKEATIIEMKSLLLK